MWAFIANSEKQSPFNNQFHTHRSQGSFKIQRMLRVPWGKPRPFQVSTKHTHTHTHTHIHTYNIPQCVVVVFWEKYSRMGFASKSCSSILSEELKLTETPQGEYDTSCFCSNTFSGCAWACALTYVEASLFPGLGMWHPHCNLLSGEDVEMDYWSPSVLRVSLPWRDQHSEVNEPICINFVPIWSIWVVWGNALPAFLHLHHQQPLT